MFYTTYTSPILLEIREYLAFILNKLELPSSDDIYYKSPRKFSNFKFKTRKIINFNQYQLFPRLYFQEKNYYETTPIVSYDYKKMVVFVGANKAGTSFVINAVANNLSNQKILTSILDMTKDKGMYYMYNQSDRSLRKIASECMQKLAENEDYYMPISKYLKVYTTIPSTVSDPRRSFKHKSIIF